MKNQFYNNYDVQRRELPADGYPLTVIGNATNSVIHNYGPAPQLPSKHNAIGVKGRFTNSVIQDGGGAAAAGGVGYFQGYYGKQQPPSQDFYCKYEPDFIQSNPKPLNNANADQKPSDFHHIKAADFHLSGVGGTSGNIKTELNHAKLPAEFHHGKVSAAATAAAAPANFHQSHPNFYSQQHLQHTTGGTPQNHQVPMQYPNQYYPSDFDAAPGMEQGYYEHRAAGAPTNYYEGMYQQQQQQPQVQAHQQQHQYDGYGATPAAGQLHHDENYAAYPQQYFDGHANAQLHATAAITNSHHVPHGVHGQVHSGQVPQSFNHPSHAAAYHAAAQQHANGINGNAIAIGHHMDNSNSSSDFNFLSNLANDFAPEYYQLS